MSFLVKIRLKNGNSKGCEHNHPYLDICVYDNNEVISLPNVIHSISTSTETTKVKIDPDITRYEVFTDSDRIKTEKGKTDFELNLNECKLILYPDHPVIYQKTIYDCDKIAIWHLSRSILHIIDRSCRF